ncbi:hypothetical protein EDB80DRAFT_590326 [Ilyonectria destructans]|nr:hypothetical protein EDB80DRAFT_590326 [Ilyonectria destructans]
MTERDSKFIGVPTNPERVMVIREVGPRICTFSTPWERFGILWVGWRCTAVKLKTGNVAVFLPGPLTEEVKLKLLSIGPVKYILALSDHHELFLAQWAAEFPQASIIGSEGLEERHEGDAGAKPFGTTCVYTKENKDSVRISPEFDDDFVYEYCHGHGHRQIMCLHKPTHTLIEADLLFNLPAKEQFSKVSTPSSYKARNAVFAGVMNARGAMFWQKCFLWYVATAADRSGFAESAKRLRTWDVGMIIPCHGEIMETSGRERIHKITSWFVTDDEYPGAMTYTGLIVGVLVLLAVLLLSPVSPVTQTVRAWLL